MTTVGWDPEKYQQFTDERARPAQDLMDRIPQTPANTIVDLGCGAGEQARQLARRWPDATVTGVDSSPEMLARAQADDAQDDTRGIQWMEADIDTWEPPERLDVIYSNAALQWLGHHDELFPVIAGWLNPGGVLAVQMPRNFDAPSHQVMREVAADGAWASRLQGVRDASPVTAPASYYDILHPHVRHLDIWETTYVHVLEGDDPVAHWTRATGLRPFLNALNDDGEREAFFETYAQTLRTHYPQQADGKTLFPFQRLFIVAHR